MKQKWLLIIGIGIIGLEWNLSGQEAYPIPLQMGTGSKNISIVQKIPVDSAEPFLAFNLLFQESPQQVSIRFSDEAGNWTNWILLQHDIHSGEESNTQSATVLGFTNKNHRYFQVQANNNQALEEVKILFYNPGKTVDSIKEEPIGINFRNEACPCEIPMVVRRGSWCPDNNCPPDANPLKTEVRHLVVHHSAGPNVAEDWPAVVRSIWSSHVNGNGWADIGYNWLIDPTGKLYEGRGDDILGAHFCGANSGTMGVCLLGNFMEGSPSPQAMATLKWLLTWKACTSDIDPLGQGYHIGSGKIFPNILGHREGCNTLCPGDNLYTLLPVTRQQVNDQINTCLSTSAGEIAAEPNFKLFPNPAHTSVQLQWENLSTQPTMILVQDLSGKNIFQIEPASHAHYHHLDIRQLPAGVYFVHILANDRRYGRKMIKQ